MVKILSHQLNFTVGDIQGNYQKILQAYQKSCQKNAQLAVFSELAISGYPPQDLLLKQHFIDECLKAINELSKATKDQDCAILVGAPNQTQDRFGNKHLENCAFYLKDGEVIDIISKKDLPNEKVFDEKRYFKAANTLKTIQLGDKRIAVLICQDLWNLKNSFLLKERIFNAIIAINASPYNTNKLQKRHQVAEKFCHYLQAPLIYLNQIGGQDNLVFDGSSFILNQQGVVINQAKSFQEDCLNLDLNSLDKQESNPSLLKQDINKELSDIYQAIILATRDYVKKSGFKKVIIGLSGGIDSAFCACIASDALGSDNVNLYALPTRYSSKESEQDALLNAKNLDNNLKIISIDDIFSQFLTTLKPEFKDTKPNIAEENIQSRIRGNILMALANKFNYLMLTCGNKSEMAVGYATLYGDMCGAFNPLKDLYKTKIYQLAKWRNQNIPEISIFKKTNLIPENILTKEPTAELKENQKDSDSLPEYEILDQILYQLIEQEKSIEDIANSGINEKIVKEVANLFYKSEYKRRQSPIGAKISPMSFDFDRRYPIINHFKD